MVSWTQTRDGHVFCNSSQALNCRLDSTQHLLGGVALTGSDCSLAVVSLEHKASVDSLQWRRCISD